VEHDELEVGEGLIEDAPDALVDVAGHIPGRHHDTQGHRPSHATLSPTLAKAGSPHAAGPPGGASPPASSRLGRLPRLLLAPRLVGPELNAEDRATGRIVLDQETAAVRLDDRMGDRQPHAEPVRLGGEERLEDPAEITVGNSLARVLHANLDVRPDRR